MNAPADMVWYRHWLEMRWAFVPLSILYLLFISMDSSNALRWDVWFALPAHPFGPELSATPLGRAIGGRIDAWAAFAGRIPWFGFATSWVLAGSGVQNLIHPGFPMAGSTMHVLTLPVSRTRLAVTRYISALVLALVAGLMVGGIGLTFIYLGGDSVPMAAIGQSVALGLIYVATILAVGSAFAASLPRAYVWRVLLHLGVFVLSMVPIHYLVASPARGEWPWDLLAVFGLLWVVSLYVTVRQVSRQEY